MPKQMWLASLYALIVCAVGYGRGVTQPVAWDTVRAYKAQQ
jgi:hypothetical protein